MSDALPRERGTYALLLHLPETAQAEVGRLGTVSFAPGRYLYVGSAHGAGGLAARVARHLRADKVRHWHVDTLTALARPVEVWFATGQARLECAWAEALAATPGVTIPVAGFGSSDCGCPSHLFHLEREVVLVQAKAMLTALPPKEELHCDRFGMEENALG
jgi:Uri superfamily endonuclease